MQNTVRFASDLFNATVVHDHFINPCCFGEDVADWLKPRFELRGYRVNEPGQEDWGWYLGCDKDGAAYMLSIGLLEEDEGPQWQVILEVKVPLLKRIFRPKPQVPAHLRQELHRILESELEIRVLEWLYLSPRGSESESSALPNEGEFASAD